MKRKEGDRRGQREKKRDEGVEEEVVVSSQKEIQPNKANK